MESGMEIRRRLLSLRDGMAGEERDFRSRRVQQRFWETDFARGVRNVALYSPIRNEVETSDLFLTLRRDGKRVFYPSVRDEEIGFSEEVDPAQMKAGRFGILEPQGGVPIPLEELDVVVIPGVAFDEDGFRLGFGKGCYDRALARFSGIKVGLAYDFQILKSLLRREGDLRCDAVVSEKRTIER